MPAGSQYILDSPLPVLLGHLLGIQSLLGVGLLMLGYILFAPMVLVALWGSGKLSIGQAISVAAVFCVLPTWKVLFQYFGKPDGLVIALAALIVLTSNRKVFFTAGILLVTVHLQIGIAILFSVALLDWPHRDRRWLLILAGATGVGAAKLTQLLLGATGHRGRMAYVLGLWKEGPPSVSPWLLVALVGALGGAWMWLAQRYRFETLGGQARLVLAVLAAVVLSLIAVDTSRDMFLLGAPIVLWSQRERVLRGGVDPLRPAFLALALICLPFPDVLGGKIRENPLRFPSRLSNYFSPTLRLGENVGFRPLEPNRNGDPNRAAQREKPWAVKPL